MAKSCGGSIVKILLAVFNFIWMALGSFVIYLGVSAFQYNSEDYFQDIIKINLKAGTLVLMIFGSAVVLIALIGFFGACCESYLLLNVYAGLLCLLLVTNCVGIYFGYRYKDEFQQKFSDGVKLAIKDSFNQAAKPDQKMAFALQQIQFQFKCCGWEGPADYEGTEVPASCCKEEVNYGNATLTCARTSIQFSKGCVDSPVVNFLKTSAWVSAYSLILLQLIVILAACCLARDLNSYQRVNTSD